MTRIVVVAALALAVGCGGKIDRYEPVAGSAGAPMASVAQLSESGAGGAMASGKGGAAGDDAAERYCSQYVDYRDTGGFWCSRDGVIVETATTDGCESCYLVTCLDWGFRYVQVECSGL